MIEKQLQALAAGRKKRWLKKQEVKEEGESSKTETQTEPSTAQE